MSLFDDTIMEEAIERTDRHLHSLNRRAQLALKDLGIDAYTTWDPKSGRFSLGVWEMPLDGVIMSADNFVARLEDLAREIA